jgi:hypothetical protein
LTLIDHLYYPLTGANPCPEDLRSGHGHESTA